MDIKKNKAIREEVKPRPYMGNLTSSQIGNMVKQGVFAGENYENIIIAQEDNIVEKQE